MIGEPSCGRFGPISARCAAPRSPLPEARTLTARPVIVRLFWVAAGLVSTALGFLGVVLPLLPTVPFMILAAFCFAKGSRRLHAWIVERSPFGPTIVDWKKHGAISRRAKRLAAGSMLASFLFPVAAGLSWTIVAGQAFVLAGVAAFVLSRPSPPA